MDKERSKSVQEAFIQLYERGILYRSKRMVNWCCALQTAISDVELEDLEVEKPTKMAITRHKGTYEFRVLIDFAYKLKKDLLKKLLFLLLVLKLCLGILLLQFIPTMIDIKN